MSSTLKIIMLVLIGMVVGGVLATCARAQASCEGVACRPSKKQVVRMQRDIPPNARLAYSVNGQVVHTMDLPVGRATVTIVLEPKQ